MLGLGLLFAVMPADTLAQGTPLPTPTNIGGGGGNSGSSGSSGSQREGKPIPVRAAVSGFVYDYSKGGYQDGVTVIVKGGGWQVETVSDSNGFYRLGDLGNGSGTISLRLPPDTHPVTFEWPVQFYEGAEVQANLGYYWGDKPPMPVLLSGSLSDNMLVVQVENRTSDTSAGSVIEIETPANIKVSPAIEVGQGQMIDLAYDPHQLRLKMGDLAAGAVTTVKLPLKHTAINLEPNQTISAIRVTFTYDQQYTPQVIEFDADQLIQSPTALQTNISAKQTPAAQLTPASQPVVSVQLTPPVEPTPTSQPTPTAPPTPAAVPIQPTLSPAALTAQPVEPTPGLQLPTTGSDSDASGEVVKLLLAVMLMLGLTLAGWWSLKDATRF